jgi:hypothetical protein
MAVACNDRVLLMPFMDLHVMYPFVTMTLLQAFGKYNMWLAAENGMFLRHTHGEWMTTMPEHLNMDWVESVQVGCIVIHYSTQFHGCYGHLECPNLVWSSTSG